MILPFSMSWLQIPMIKTLSQHVRIWGLLLLRLLAGSLALLLNTAQGPSLSPMKRLRLCVCVLIYHHCNKNFWACTTNGLICRLDLCYAFVNLGYHLRGFWSSGTIYHPVPHVYLGKNIASPRIIKPLQLILVVPPEILSQQFQEKMFVLTNWCLHSLV